MNRECASWTNRGEVATEVAHVTRCFLVVSAYCFSWKTRRPHDFECWNLDGGVPPNSSTNLIMRDTGWHVTHGQIQTIQTRRGGHVGFLWAIQLGKVWLAFFKMRTAQKSHAYQMRKLCCFSCCLLHWCVILPAAFTQVVISRPTPAAGADHQPKWTTNRCSKRP